MFGFQGFQGSSNFTSKRIWWGEFQLEKLLARLATVSISLINNLSYQLIAVANYLVNFQALSSSRTLTCNMHKLFAKEKHKF